MSELFTKHFGHQKILLASINDIPAYLYVSTRNRCLNYLQQRKTAEVYQKRLVDENQQSELDETIYQHIYEAETIRMLHYCNSAASHRVQKCCFTKSSGLSHK